MSLHSGAGPLLFGDFGAQNPHFWAQNPKKCIFQVIVKISSQKFSKLKNFAYIIGQKHDFLHLVDVKSYIFQRWWRWYYSKYAQNDAFLNSFWLVHDFSWIWGFFGQFLWICNNSACSDDGQKIALMGSSSNLAYISFYNLGMSHCIKYLVHSKCSLFFWSKSQFPALITDYW